ncbi:MAG: hypothetical protein V1798_02335 [Pseudomonadota bacterium]
MNHRPLSWFLVPLSLFWASLPAYGSTLRLAEPEDPITPHRGDGVFLFSVSGGVSDDFFTSSGSLKDSSDPSFRDGTQEQFIDLTFLLSAEYGLTDDLTLWLDFPLAYRKETLAFNASNFGLGDTHAGAAFRFWGRPSSALEAAFGIEGRFPSGDTQIGFSQASTGHSLKLPLGTGNQDLAPLALLKWHITPALSWDADFSYAFRFAADVEYLQTTTILQASADQTQTASLPVGNLHIDWGDEVRLGSRWAWRPARWNFVALRLDYLYRRPTRIRNFNFTVNGSTFDSAVDDARLDSAMLLTVTPSWTLELSRDVSLLMNLAIPVWGESYPTLPLVESLVGLKAELGIAYAF